MEEGAGDQVHVLVPGPVGEAHVGQGAQRAFLPVGRCHPERDQGRLDVLLGGQGGDEVEGLEDEADRGGAHLGQPALPQPGQILAAEQDRA